jgi:hypothetical protein
MADLPEQRAQVHQTYDRLSHLLSTVDNVGMTQDRRDLYWVMAQVVQVTQAVHPDFLCRSGCNHCCHGDNVVMVSAIEWQLLYPHLCGLPEAIRHTIVRDTQETWGPILHMLLPGKAGYQDGGKVRLVPKEMQAVIHCPLLVYGKCSAYASRPFQCRSFGNFAVIDEKAAAVLYMCTMAKDHIDETFPQDTALPILNPYHRQLVALEGANPVYALLPLWIAAHIDGTDLRPDCDLQPDFEAVVSRFQAGLPPVRR